MNSCKKPTTFWSFSPLYTSFYHKHNFDLLFSIGHVFPFFPGAFAEKSFPQVVSQEMVIFKWRISLNLKTSQTPSTFDVTDFGSDVLKLPKHIFCIASNLSYILCCIFISSFFFNNKICLTRSLWAGWSMTFSTWFLDFWQEKTTIRRSIWLNIDTPDPQTLQSTRPSHCM